MSKGVKVKRYRRTKHELRYERYLSGNNTRREIANYVKARAGVVEWREETGRWEKLERDQRDCEFCESGQIEDAAHFFAECESWEEQRREVRKECGWRGEEGEELVDWILGGTDARGSEGIEQTTEMIRKVSGWIVQRRERERDKKREQRVEEIVKRKEKEKERIETKRKDRIRRKEETRQKRQEIERIRKKEQNRRKKGRRQNWGRSMRLKKDDVARKTQYDV
jgi:hypothetical protein